jgi:hypothetical protein
MKYYVPILTNIKKKYRHTDMKFKRHLNKTILTKISYTQPAKNKNKNIIKY